MNIKRLSALNSVIIERFFAEFEQLQTEYNVKMKDIYNMNETEFQLDQIAGNYVVYDSAVSHSVISKSDNTQWASIIECVKVNKAIKPYLIFTDKTPEDHMFPNNEELPNIIWIFSLKKWTDNELTINWLQQIFIPQT